MNPDIAPAIGGHQNELISENGIWPSEPGYFASKVFGPVQAKSICMPRILNDQGRGPGYGVLRRDEQIRVVLSMPSGVRRCDIDSDAPLVFYPGEVQGRYSGIYQVSECGQKQTYVAASFDKDDCLNNLCVGFNDVEIAGRFTSGRYFYGSSRVYVTGYRCGRWRFLPLRKLH